MYSCVFRYLPLYAVLVLAACASQNPQQCPDIGIDLTNPDFTQKHRTSDIDAFYKCIYAATPEYHLAGVLGMMMSNGLPSRDTVKFQWNLWRQISTHQKSPETAQESWLVWESGQKAISASQDAAAAASRPMNCTSMNGMTNCY